MPKIPFQLRYPILFSALASALTVPTLYAQEQQLQETAKQEEAVEAIERIIVTARLRQEQLNKIPVSVSAYSGEQMVRTGIRNVNDIIDATPGVTYDSIGGMASGSPVIRGLAQPGLVGDETNVAVFIDGVYASGRDATFLPFGGLQRVEVVRGPQSAIYGRNAFAGAINYITKDPTDKFEGGIDSALGTHGMHNAHFYVSGALSERFKARLDLSDSSSGSTIRNTNTMTGEKIDNRRLGEAENQLARLKLVYDGDNTKISLSHTHIDTEESPRATAHVEHNGGYGIRNVAQEFGVLQNGVHVQLNPQSGQWEFMGPWVYTGDPQKYLGVVTNQLWQASFAGVAPEATGTKRKTDRTSLVFEHNLDNFSVTYLGGYNRSEYLINLGQLNDYSGMAVLPTAVHQALPLPARPSYVQTSTQGDLTFYLGLRGYDLGGQPNDDREEYSHELRFIGNHNGIEWATGAFYSKLKLDQSTRMGVIGSDPYSAMILNAFGSGYETNGLAVLQGSRHETTTKSMFGAVEFSVTEKLTMALEGRWTSEDKFADNHTDTRAPGILFPTGEMNGSWNYFTPRVTLDYDANDTTLYYVNVGKGAKSGGLNGAAEGNEMTFDPEQNWTYEAGIKSFLFENKLRFNLAAYYIDWDKQQVRDFSTLGNQTNAVPAVIVTNLGKTEVKGLELDGRWQITGNFGLNFAAAYNDARVKKGGLGPEFGFLDYEAQGMNATPWPVTQYVTMVSTRPPVFGVVGQIQVPPAGAMVSDGDVSGRKMPRASRITANASIDYVRDWGHLNSFSELSISYRSSQYLDSLNLTELPSSYTVKGTIGMETGSIRLSLFVDNLTNNSTPSGGYRKYLWNGKPQFVVEPRMGRMAGINFAYKF